MTAVEVARLGPGALLALGGEIRSVYAAAFGGPPWHEPAHTADDYLLRLARDARRPGFTAATAYGEDGRLIGFATAWTTPRPFPADRCYAHVSGGLGQPRTRAWLCGAREVDELAVHPDHAGRGAGAALVEEISAGVPDDRCWLLTTAAAGGPLDFYRRLGWHPVTLPEPDSGGLVVLLGPRHPGAGTAGHNGAAG
ncbi:GNAT family N-acetyltransferase [Kitasatospora sp. NBC_01287]|uniref:GNAT family N-acetyltransferase n=1 Tax=Kitasatospora sp. NBC_01287 TaxID=2903573 RepID=UPI00224F1224|nr:GNAT family N-acetyltransferase [Kitasatospora sp. NBC_01287]MCX4743994.1 GNAT family N-acetyltransferase [Kitasatospora sp. NBC_01287]